MHMTPAFTSAMQDRALRGRTRDVYVWLNEQLDLVDFRAIKHSAIEADLQMRDSNVFRALDLLIERGYLKRGPRDGRLWTYRLVYSNPGAAAPALLPPKSKQSLP